MSGRRGQSLQFAATRRGFLGGAAVAAGAAATGARAAQAADHGVRAAGAGPLAERRDIPRGSAIAVSRGVVVVGHAGRRTIAVTARGATRVIDVGGEPVAIAARGNVAAVATAFWDEPGLAIVDLRAGTVRRVDAGPAPTAVAFSHDGKRILVVGGDQEGTLTIIDAAKAVVRRHGPVGPVPRGLAAVPNAAFVTLNARDEVVRVNDRTGRVTRTLRTPRLPDQIAAAPDGRHLLLSHGHAETVTELDLRTLAARHLKAGRLPVGVAYAGARRVVALGGDPRIVVIGRRRVRRAIGGAPRGLAVSGTRAYTVDGLTAAVSRVKL